MFAHFESFTARMKLFELINVLQLIPFLQLSSHWKYCLESRSFVFADYAFKECVCVCVW